MTAFVAYASKYRPTQNHMIRISHLPAVGKRHLQKPPCCSDDPGIINHGVEELLSRLHNNPE